MKPQARIPAFAGGSQTPVADRPADQMARRVLAALSCVLLVLSFSAAHAQSPFRLAAEPELKPRTLVEPPGISLEQATNIVRRQTGGRVLSAAPSGRGGSRGYEVRVLVDGKRVKTVFVDSRGNLRSRD